MKPYKFIRLAALGLMLLAAVSSPAVILTNNTSISPFDTSYDGADIVISNCAVTVDGTHSFNSLLVAPTGVLTHSFWASGNSNTIFTVVDEPQTMNGTNPVTLLNANVGSVTAVTDSAHTVTYTNGSDYVQTNPGDGTTQLQRTETSTIPDGATVLVTYNLNDTIPAGLHLSVSNDVTIANGGIINANASGYGSSMGPGRGFSANTAYFDGSGAGHGGNGGISSSNAIGGICYGSPTQPTSLGSGGGMSYASFFSGGSGGGAIQIFASGTVINDGVISANGADATNSRTGGGAGGSIWITATNVSGSGSFVANGGAGEPVHGGGGGGGRISIQCGTNLFSGTMTAYGGSGWNTGGAGTIFTQSSEQTGLLLVDNGGQAGTNTTITLGSVSNLVISGHAGVIPLGAFGPGNLTIGTNSLLTGLPTSSLTIYVPGNLTIQPGGALSVDGLGYSAGNGTGAGHNYYSGNNYYPCGGGGYGGYGAAAANTNGAGGTTYGSQTAPANFGSGGGTILTSVGGSGGGAIQLTVGGSLQLDGRITANGGNGSGTGGGGGSGGTVSVSCGTVTGSGSITANGGNGAAFIGGGGGGGRIAVITPNNTFSGTLLAAGGGGTNWGGAGTIFVQAGNQSSLILDNAGHNGAGTLLQSASSANLIVQNGAAGTANSGVTFASLLVSSNAWLTSPFSYGSQNYIINGNATFQPGGGFLANYSGSAAGQGSGYGGYTSYFPYACGGGGHGGSGGYSISNSAAGGQGGYDLASVPMSSYPASGGGNYPPNSFGGSGGGFVQMTVNGTLQMDGLITANGANGSGIGGGGGAGGSVYLTTGTFAGSGTITANGGNGVDSIGGGGGGGRIAVYFNNNSYAGNLAAIGGSGANYGGAGTIYLKTNNAVRAQIIVDNAGHSGANTPYSSSPAADLTLRNGSSTYLSSSMSLGNLYVGSNAWLVVSNSFTSPSSATLNAINVTVQPGGGISADGTGSTANSGNGSGNGSGATSPIFACSGAGHGGYGANSISNTYYGGGNVYDNAASPGIAGSGGGSYANYSFGGRGGGAIQMNLSGNLQVDGALTANGANGFGSGGGGGSGGSLNVTCLTLAGSGSITVNGGAGANNFGGGGAGGMIAVNFTSNAFTGTISSYGGSGGGVNWAGAGTVYLKTNFFNQVLLIVDNGGHRGTNTPVIATSYLAIRNGAVAVQSYPPQTISGLLITSNAWLVGSSAPGNNYPGIVNLTVQGNAVLQSGGGILNDATGSAQNSGNGRGYFYGASPFYACSGAGHGGYGAFALSNQVAGGITFDSTMAPNTAGSGGGGYLPFSTGGAGGGYVNLRVNGTLQLDGSISANGSNGSGSGGGGGSGGSINLNLGSFIGSGSISANGGRGAGSIGGGGGGGRIAIVNIGKTNSFAGKISAYGGGGANYGGAGTIFTQTNTQQYGQLLLDNANNAGTNTTFDLLSVDAIIQNHAIGVLPPNSIWIAHNILIRTNGTLTSPAYASGRTLNVINLTIDGGSALTLDGAGYGPQSGPGSGSALSLNPRGGGGHGGYGGGNLVFGGIAYDSIQFPIIVGSGGASYYNGNGTSNNGGAGGGALSLIVGDTLTVNGRLTANGNNGDFNAGGGAGGSLNLLSVFKLSGHGTISANGGSATGLAGGGAGGRIAMLCYSNNFTGQLSAFGGNGSYPGGAGTIYTRLNNNANTLIVDNGGLAGTNTPLGSAYSMPSASFDLNIAGTAAVVQVTPLPLINNLNLAAGSKLTVSLPQSQLFFAVQSNANLAGSVIVDKLGFAQAQGIGMGHAIANKGSGGGYGGIGGASASGAQGGLTYGSAAQPMDFGSGGGLGFNSITGGSVGGGALRLSVGGTLNVDGNVSANGDFGWQDDSGGGAGGSIWITAGTLSGTGTISASGGDGEPAGGGGGGGGRIAIYASTNLFLGFTNASGGTGATPGQPGTIFLSGALLDFLIVSHSPNGTIPDTVGHVDLAFNEAVAPDSFSSAAFTFTTPAGVMDSSNLTVSATDATTVRVSFPVQNLLGDYSLQVATNLTNIFGLPLASAYTANFTIILPTISGTVTDTNGVPVAGVLVQPDGGLAAVTTDGNGNYAIGVPFGWNGTVTPALGSFMFVPGSFTYADIAGSLTDQNFLIVPTVAPDLGSGFDGTNLTLTWNGIPGVTYQAWSSTNLVDWLPYGDAIPGTNGPQQIVLPVDDSPALFFRVVATH